MLNIRGKTCEMFWVVMLMFFLFLFGDSSELEECEEENAELKKQIEQLKCCGNCKHWNCENIQKYCEISMLKSENMDNCIKWSRNKNEKNT